MRRNYGKYTFSVGALVTLALLGSEEGIAGKAYPQDNDFGMQSDRNIYVGLSYSPAWHRIENFSVGANDGSTAARFPSLHSSKKRWETSSFDWDRPTPSIDFKRNSPLSLEGSFGYRLGSARMELEVGYEKFEAKAGQGASTEYLLAKDLVHNLLTKQSQGLASALARVDARDIVEFAQSVKLIDPEIDKKVCFRQVGRSTYYSDTKLRIAQHEPWSCVDYVKTKFGPSTGVPGYPEYGVGSLSTRFGKLEGYSKKQEDSEDGTKTNRGWPGTSEGKTNTAKGMAEDLINRLNNEERKTVARILTQKVAGAEVVKIQALTSTSVMVNACYDLQHDRLRATPFACLGIGANFVSVVDGHISSRLAWKAKAGLSYQLSPRVTVFASGFYNRVFSAEAYDELPVYRLADDATSNKSRQFAKASFKMAYAGAELGVRLLF